MSTSESGETPSERAQQVWDDESPSQGPRLTSGHRRVVPGTTDDPERGPDAWVEDGEGHDGGDPGPGGPPLGSADPAQP